MSLVANQTKVWDGRTGALTKRVYQLTWLPKEIQKQKMDQIVVVPGKRRLSFQLNLLCATSVNKMYNFGIFWQPNKTLQA